VNTLYIIALLWMAEVFSPSYGNQSSPFGLGIAHPVRRRRFHEIDAQDLQFQQQKRCRLTPTEESAEIQHFSSDQNIFVNPKKRGRFGVLDENNEHIDYAQEFNNLRSQFTAELAERESQTNNLHSENVSLKQQLQQFQNELMKLQEENKILKKAVHLQNSKSKELEKSFNCQQQSLSQAAEHIKRLEQTNYALRVHLEANSTPQSFSSFEQRPPDVF